MHGKLNPYSDWLDLDAHDCPTLYELLGLSDLEEDPWTIANAAAASLAKVRGIRPGANVELWRQLRGQVEHARACLMDLVAKRDYDRELREGRGSVEFHSAKVPSLPLSSTETNSSPYGRADDGPHGADLHDLVPQVRRHGARSVRSTANVTMLVVLCAVLGAVVLGVMIIRHTRSQDADTTQAQRARSRGMDERVSPTDKRDSPHNHVHDPASATAADNGPSHSDTDDGNATDPPAGNDASPMDDSDPPDLSSQRAQELVDAPLDTAIERLRDRDVEGALSQLRAAEERAGTPELKEAVTRTRLLAMAVDNFWTTFDEAISSLQSSQTLILDGKPAVIIEVTSQRLSIRQAGRTQRFSTDALPLKMVLAVAATRFDETAASTDINIGAFHLIDPSGDVQEAKRHWERAARHGDRATAERLMPLLDNLATP